MKKLVGYCVRGNGVYYACGPATVGGAFSAVDTGARMFIWCTKGRARSWIKARNRTPFGAMKRGFYRVIPIVRRSAPPPSDMGPAGKFVEASMCNHEAELSRLRAERASLVIDNTSLRDKLGDSDHTIAELQREVGRQALELRRAGKCK